MRAGFGSVDGTDLTPPDAASCAEARVATSPGPHVVDDLTVQLRTRLTSALRVDHDLVARPATQVQPCPIEHWVLACLVFRRVRASTGSANQSAHAERSALAPAGRGAAAAKLRAGPRSERPGSRPPCGGPESLAEIFLTRWAELACRHVHALAIKESDRDDRQDPTDAL